MVTIDEPVEGLLKGTTCSLTSRGPSDAGIAVIHTWRPRPRPVGPREKLGRQFQDLANLRRAGDRPRVARHPRRAHCLLGYPVEALPPDLDRTEAPRHPEPGDEPIEH